MTTNRGSEPPIADIISTFSRRVQHVLDRIDKRRAIAGESDNSTLCIGGPGDFSLVSQPTISIDWGDDDPEKEKLPRYTELEAVVREVRVTNPEDEEQYVDILARNSSLIEDDVGEQFWVDWLQDLTNQTRAS